MIDFSKLSDNDLQAIADGDMTRVSDAALEVLAGRGKVTEQPKIDHRAQGFENLASEYGPAQAGLVSVGKGFYNVGRGLGLLPKADQTETEAFSALQNKHPVSTTLGEAVGEAAPFVPLGFAAGSIPGTAARVGAGATIGGTEGAIISEGRGGNPYLGAAMGATIAGTADLVLPHLVRAGSSLYRQVTGKAPTGAVVSPTGEPSQQFLQILNRAGLTYDEVADNAFHELAREVGPDVAQRARKEFLESQGLRPTRAQVTRDATDFQTQQELAKSTGRVRTALESQDAVIQDRFRDTARQTGGQVATDTNTVVDNVVNKSENLTNEITQLYKEARDLAPGEKNVRPNALTAVLRRYAPADSKAGGNVSAVVGELQHRGVLGKKFQIKGKIDVNTAEEVRQYINSMYDPQGGFGNQVLKELKDALDDDVFKASGGDFYSRARAAKSNYESGLARARVSRFDSRKANLVRDIQENKINPDTFINDVVFSKKWRAQDLSQLKAYVDDPKAWDDMRAQTIEGLMNRAFSGPIDANGYQEVTRAGLERAINSIGWGKLDVLFSTQERKFLKDMLLVAKMREPVRKTALGQGPSAQAIRSLEQRMANLPIIGSLIQFADFDSQGRMLIRPRVVNEITPIQKQLSGAGGALAVPFINQEEDQR